jgi:hypothetical protein
MQRTDTESSGNLSPPEIQISTIQQTKICSAQIGIPKNGVSRFTEFSDLMGCKMG